MSAISSEPFSLGQLSWNEQGLMPAIAQDWRTGKVLMLAWMNPESLQLTLREGRAVYWSRSRQCLWRKGETSGHIQTLKELSLDCDQDCILMQVEQIGGIACHTGREHCFYRVFQEGRWCISSEPLQSADEIYRS